MMSVFEAYLKQYQKTADGKHILNRPDLKTVCQEYPEARRVLETLHDIFGPLTVEIINGGIDAPPSSADLVFVSRLKQAYNFNLARYKKACQFFRSAEARPEAKAAAMEKYLEICRKVDFLYVTISEIEGENFEAITGGYDMEEVKCVAA